MTTSRYFIRYAKDTIDDLREINSYYKKINPALVIRFKEGLLLLKQIFLIIRLPGQKLISGTFARLLLINSLTK